MGEAGVRGRGRPGPTYRAAAILGVRARVWKAGVIPGLVSRLAVARPGEAGETTGPTSGPRWSAAKREAGVRCERERRAVCGAWAERGVRRRAGGSGPSGQLGYARGGRGRSGPGCWVGLGLS